jgi:hypothetical protein
MISLASKLSTVFARHKPSIFNRPAQRARLLSFLLLACIGWGTTAEFMHHHGAAVESRFTVSATDTSTASPTTSPRIETNQQQRSSSTTNSAADCLICQLHQNLASTLFNSPPRAIATEVSVVNKLDAPVLQLSEFAANQHGRAPPINL